MKRSYLPAMAIVFLLTASCAGEPPAEIPRNTLNWQAATEDGVFGYIVFRSDRREGPFRRINDQIIRVPRDRQGKHDYSWVDDAVESGKTYYYYLDAVSRTGIKQRFSGIIDRTTP